MANVDGVDLTLPNGDVFEFRGNITLQVEHAPEWLLSGGSSIVGFAEGIFDDLGSGAIIRTPMASGYIGNAGTRTFEIQADNWAGETGQFGAANNDDSVLEKMAVLENTLATELIDSRNPATLEWGPYSSGTSRYEPIPVVPTQVTPSVNFEESATAFRSRVTLVESIDLGQPIDDATGASADFRLTPDGDTSPEIPLPEDTLGAGGRETGAQVQGRDAAPSSLVDTNGSGSDPQTAGPSITPESIRLRGAFRGSNAKSLADTLKTDFIQNDSVEKVNITAPNRSSPEPLTGTYVLGSDTRVDPVTPQVEGDIYEFLLDLQQA